MGALSGYDAWVTREPPWQDDEPRPVRCSCGRFLKQTPEATRSWVAVELCTGAPSVIECVYGDSHGDEGILAIIGEEFRGKTYRVAYPASCGSMKGSSHAAHSGEIEPDDAEGWRHAPHFFVQEWGYQEVALRTCVCGRVNEEVLT